MREDDGRAAIDRMVEQLRRENPRMTTSEAYKIARRAAARKDRRDEQRR